MDSLVLQLQRDCLNANIPTLEIMRKALVVAKKLNIVEFQKWITKEIEGYKAGDEIPNYRMVRGAIKAWNPFRGWIDLMFENARLVEALSERAIGQPIGELDTLTKDSAGGYGHVPFPPETEEQLLNAMHPKMKPALEVSGASIKGITDRVRDIVLQWSLDLEAKGILGEGMTFSDREKETASHANYHIHYHGNVGTSQIQQGTIDSSQVITAQQFDIDAVRTLISELRTNVTRLKLTMDQSRQLAAELGSIEAQLSAPEPRRGVIAECLNSIRNILEGCAGSLIASGLLQRLAQVWPG